MADKTYTISTAQPEDNDEIENHLYKNFFNDMPLFRIFGFQEGPRRKVFSPETDKTIPFIVKAVSSENEIIGVAISRTKLSFPPSTDVDNRLIQLYEFMKYVETAAKISSLPENTVELRILSVASNWRGKGVAKQLTEESVRIAKQKGFEVMKICCTNEFTAKLVQSFGFQEIYKLAYSDYSNVSGKDIVLDAFPPHYFIYYYTKYLQQ